MSCPHCHLGWRNLNGLLAACTCDAGLQRVLQGARTFDEVIAPEPPPRVTNAAVRARAIYGWRQVAAALGIEEPMWMRGEPAEAPPVKTRPASLSPCSAIEDLSAAKVEEGTWDEYLTVWKQGQPPAPGDTEEIAPPPPKAKRTYRTKPKPVTSTPQQ